MSKSSVPEVYARVIKEVCEASRQDFEEGGVDLGALELLQQGWQKRLSAEHIATFPWDPKPEPAPKPESTLNTSNANTAPATLPSNGATLTPPSSNSTPGPHIKQENPQYTAQPPQHANYTNQAYPQSQPMSAQQRAAMNLQERYGQQASSQIAQLQNQQRLPPNVSVQGHMQQPYIKSEFKQEDSSSQNFQHPSYNASVPVKTSQTDGAADAREEYETEIAYRRSLVTTNREAGDRLIRDQVLASQQALEGGGLLLPLETRTLTHSPNGGRRITGVAKSSLARAQGDATGDDEDDEDAINSDLDDPDELDDANADEDNVSNVMLCTYDKVQRVKNKWKCTLKDGVLKVDGSEFVFHKGQGEFEW